MDKDSIVREKPVELLQGECKLATGERGAKGKRFETFYVQQSEGLVRYYDARTCSGRTTPSERVGVRLARSSSSGIPKSSRSASFIATTRRERSSPAVIEGGYSNGEAIESVSPQGGSAKQPSPVSLVGCHDEELQDKDPRRRIHTGCLYCAVGSLDLGCCRSIERVDDHLVLQLGTTTWFLKPGIESERWNMVLAHWASFLRETPLFLIDSSCCPEVFHSWGYKKSQNDDQFDRIYFRLSEGTLHYRRSEKEVESFWRIKLSAITSVSEHIRVDSGLFTVEVTLPPTITLIYGFETKTLAEAWRKRLCGMPPADSNERATTRVARSASDATVRPGPLLRRYRSDLGPSHTEQPPVRTFSVPNLRRTAKVPHKGGSPQLAFARQQESSGSSSPEILRSSKIISACELLVDSSSIAAVLVQGPSSCVSVDHATAILEALAISPNLFAAAARQILATSSTDAEETLLCGALVTEVLKHPGAMLTIIRHLVLAEWRGDITVWRSRTPLMSLYALAVKCESASLTFLDRCCGPFLETLKCCGVSCSDTALTSALQALFHSVDENLIHLNGLQRLILREAFTLTGENTKVLSLLLMLRFVLPYLSHPAHSTNRDLMRRVIKLLCYITSDGDSEESWSPELFQVCKELRQRMFVSSTYAGMFVDVPDDPPAILSLPLQHLDQGVVVQHLVHYILSHAAPLRAATEVQDLPAILSLLQ